SLMWLMGAPAGLKLNSELTSFLGEIFLYLMQLWSEWISLSRPILQDVIRVVALTGIFGISTPICIASDLLSMCTLHLHLCYIVASKVYYWQVKAILFLFTLFRGKRKNTLRNRVDSADYGLDQLLLGTMFFALLIFLFPTVTVYYAFFSMVRISVVIAQAIPELLLVVINHFPLHQLM
ncbi:N-acetylglucosaminyl transferase component-domain-containing protein, partial [Phlyctochytrium arcticum]